jgi:acetyl-CoA acetyltransferase
MVEALTIDACRTPRGIGKAGKGALSDIHPQQLGATVLRTFAVVAEKYIRDLKLDWDRVNVNGGSIALGHPISASCSILTGTLLKRKALQSKAISLKNLRVTSLSMLKWQLRARPGGHSVGVGINTLQSEE